LIPHIHQNNPYAWLLHWFHSLANSMLQYSTKI
jgi:hypothetical protein